MPAATRRAGVSAGRRYRTLSRRWRRRIRPVLLVVYAVAGVLIVAGYFWVQGNWKLWLGALAGGALGIAMTLRDSPPKYIENWRTGQEGERRTAKRLAQLPKAAWHCWHDLSDDGDANIDHIVLGAAGLFLLDTKNFLGEATVESGRVVIRQIEDPNDRSTWRGLVPAVKGASASLAERVRAVCGVRPWVQPVVVLWTRFPQRAAADSGVQFVYGKAVVDWLTSQPHRLSPQQVERLRGAMDALASTPAAEVGAVTAARGRRLPIA